MVLTSGILKNVKTKSAFHRAVLEKSLFLTRMSVRHDWYQSDTSVVVTVLLKNATEKNYSVKIEAETLDVTADGYSLHLELLKPVNPDQSSHKTTPSKIEIVLKKVTGERWDSLQKTEQPAKPVQLHKRDWDRIAKENELKEAEEAKVTSAGRG